MQTTLSYEKEKRHIRSSISKQFVKFLKRDTLKVLVSAGLLRSKKEYSMGTHFLEPLIQQTSHDLKFITEDTSEFFTDLET